jgi:hypothetical protein
MKRNNQVFIVDYAYGFNARTCEVDYVCKLRCQAALRAFKKYPDAYIVLIATKPDIIKQIPLYKELKKRGHQVLLVHTGQHYDEN